MPLVRIDVLPGRTPDQLGAIADGVHRALSEAIGIPEADRFQIVSEHSEGSLMFDSKYLGIRTAGGLLVGGCGLFVSAERGRTRDLDLEWRSTYRPRRGGRDEGFLACRLTCACSGLASLASLGLARR
jgi:phenylpyruvate tautomerase PptA (4-oxalocrotonate tautomerase family)